MYDRGRLLLTYTDNVANKSTRNQQQHQQLPAQPSRLAGSPVSDKGGMGRLLGHASHVSQAIGQQLRGAQERVHNSRRDSGGDNSGGGPHGAAGFSHDFWRQLATITWCPVRATVSQDLTLGRIGPYWAVSGRYGHRMSFTWATLSRFLTEYFTPSLAMTCAY